VIEPEARRRLGVYYTPSKVADFLVRWGVRSDRDAVLEPAAGNGEFLEALVRTERVLIPPAVVIAVEIDATVAKAMQEAYPTARVIPGDFLNLGRDNVPQVDVVVGNPPFIRYQSLTDADRRRGQRLAGESGVDLSRLASSWAHFVIHAASFLREKHGRLAVVLPAEVLQTQYGASVRAFLERRFRCVTYVIIDQPVFKDAQVDAVLVLADQDGPAGPHRVRVSTVDALAALDVSRHRRRTGTAGDKPALTGAVHETYAEILASPTVAPLGSLANIDIGVVTGASDFFVLEDDARRAHGLEPPYVSRIIRRARDLAGISARSTEADWLFSSLSNENQSVAAYVALGLEAKFNEGYKCSIRDVWYSVPIPVARPDFLMPAMHHRAPRLVHNPDHLLATNLMYFVDTGEGRPTGRWLAAASLSSVTALSGEIEGRTYGGGVLKLEPSEAERLLIPAASAGQKRRLSNAFPALDALARDGKWDAARLRVDSILGINSDKVGRAAAELRGRRLGLRRRRDAGRGRPSSPG
jgi:adenine-specific DNA-methyltransferase